MNKERLDYKKPAETLTGRTRRDFFIVLGIGLVLIGGSPVRAQTRPMLVLLADFATLGNHPSNGMAQEARDAVANELNVVGQGNYKLVRNADIEVAMKSLGLKLLKDGGQATLKRDDLCRLGKALNADALLTGEVSVQSDRKKGGTVEVKVLLRDVLNYEPFNGAETRKPVRAPEGETLDAALPHAVEDAAQEAVRLMLQHAPVNATVLSIRQGVVVLNKGSRDGLRAGDEVTIYRFGNNGTNSLVGKVRVSRVTETEAEGKPVDSAAVSPEDVARKVYRPTTPK